MLGTVLGGGPYGQYGSYPLLAPPPELFGLLIDWNGSGDFTGANANVNDHLLDLQCVRGRNINNPLMGRATAGKLVAVLDNRSGLYSSLNTASPLYGNLVPGRKVQWRTVYGNRWTGYIKSIIPSRDRALPIVKVEAEGVFLQFANKRINPPADAGSLTGTIIGYILDAAGWDAGARVIDAGQSTTSRWYEADIDPMTALRRIEETELGFLYEDEDGNVVFEDRAERRSGDRLVSQATYSDAPATAFPYIDIEQQDPLPYVINEVVATVTPYTVQALQVLWTLADVPTIAPGQTLTWFANYPSPTAPSILTVGGVNVQGAFVAAWTTPVSGTDYTVSGVALGDLAVTVVKAAESMKISVRNNHATNSATLTLLQARGTPVTKGSATSVSAEDTTSQDAYGLRSYRLPAIWLQNTSQAQAYADSIIAADKDPRPLLELSFRANLSTALLVELMGRRLSDRVTVVAGEERNPLGISADFFVERIADHYDVQNNRYEVKLGLSQVGAESAPGASFWILNTSVLDTDTFLGF